MTWLEQLFGNMYYNGDMYLFIILFASIIMVILGIIQHMFSLKLNYAGYFFVCACLFVLVDWIMRVN